MLQNMNNVNPTFKTVNRNKTGFKIIFSKLEKYYGKTGSISGRNKGTQNKWWKNNAIQVTQKCRAINAHTYKPRNPYGSGYIQ